MKVLVLCMAFAAVSLAMPVGDEKSESAAPVLAVETKPEEPKPAEGAKPLPDQDKKTEVDKKEEEKSQEDAPKILPTELKPPTEEDKERAKEAIEEKNEQESEARPSEKTAVKSLPAVVVQEPTPEAKIAELTTEAKIAEPTPEAKIADPTPEAKIAEPTPEAKIAEPTPEAKPIEISPVSIIPEEKIETSSAVAPISQENIPALEAKAAPAAESKPEIVEATVTEVPQQPELKSAPIETIDVISAVKVPAAVADEIAEPAVAIPENAAKTSLQAETPITNSVPSVEEKAKSIPEPELPKTEVASNAVPSQLSESKPESVSEPNVVISDIKDSTAAPTEDILRVIRDTVDEKDKSNVTPQIKKQGEEQKEQAEEVSEKKNVDGDKTKKLNEVIPPFQQAKPEKPSEQTKIEKPCDSTPSSINKQKTQDDAAHMHITSTYSSSSEDSESNEKRDEAAEKSEERRRESENDGITDEKRQD